MNVRKLDQMGVRPTHFQIGTITIILVKAIIVLHRHLSFIYNISIVFISQRTHVFGLSEKD